MEGIIHSLDGPRDLVEMRDGAMAIDGTRTIMMITIGRGRVTIEMSERIGIGIGGGTGVGIDIEIGIEDGVLLVPKGKRMVMTDIAAENPSQKKTRLLRKRKESKSGISKAFPALILSRISSVSSVSSRSSTPTRRRSRSRSYSRRQSPPKTDTETASQQEPEPELELTLATTPPPVEEILAKRRAQREAILAKYKTAESGVSSANGTPGGAISSTALPPPPSVTISKSDVHTPQTGPAEQQPATPSGVPGQSFCSNIYLELTLSLIFRWSSFSIGLA
jgi:hypothetical protein